MKATRIVVVVGERSWTRGRVGLRTPGPDLADGVLSIAASERRRSRRRCEWAISSLCPGKWGSIARAASCRVAFRPRRGRR